MQSILKVNDFSTITVYGYRSILLKLVETLGLNANIFHGVDDDKLSPNEAHLEFYLEPFLNPGVERPLLCQFYYLRNLPPERPLDQKGFISLSVRVIFPSRKRVSKKPGRRIRIELRIFRIDAVKSEDSVIEGSITHVMAELNALLGAGT